MGKQQWKRAYHLRRFAFRDEKAAWVAMSDEGLKELWLAARDCWVKGNTDWEDRDFINRCRRNYRNKVHGLILYGKG